MSQGLMPYGSWVDLPIVDSVIIGVFSLFDWSIWATRASNGCTKRMWSWKSWLVWNFLLHFTHSCGCSDCKWKSKSCWDGNFWLHLSQGRPNWFSNPWLEFSDQVFVIMGDLDFSLVCWSMKSKKVIQNIQSHG